MRATWHKALLAVALAALLGCAKENVPPPPTWIVVGDSGSMRPVLNGGEIRWVNPTPYKDLRTGLIALTYFGGGWHPHLLVSVSRGRWTTRGVANPVNDPHPMTESNYGGTITVP